MSVILSQETLMTNLCCFGNIFYLVFGINSTIKHRQIYIINFILLMAKFSVYKCKFSFHLEKKIELYIDSLRFSMKQKAIKTLKMCKCFNIFI